MLKSVLLGAGLGIPLLAGILWLLQYGGNSAWLYCWAVTTTFSLFMLFITPTWIMPLFNKFTPLATGELKERIYALAGALHFPVKEIYIMDGSKHSKKSNAFFTGFGNNKRIVLFDTLIGQLGTPEVVAVLAHEIGHQKKHHIIVGILLSILHTGAVFYLMTLVIHDRRLFDAFYVRDPSWYAGLLFFGLLLIPLEFFISIGMQALSRKHEYEADNFAIRATGEPSAMISALKKLSLQNLSHLTPHWLTVTLRHSHPPTLLRIRRMSADAPAFAESRRQAN